MASNWSCRICGWSYIAYVPFEESGSQYRCPECHSSKMWFEHLEIDD